MLDFILLLKLFNFPVLNKGVDFLKEIGSKINLRDIIAKLAYKKKL